MNSRSVARRRRHQCFSRTNTNAHDLEPIAALKQPTVKFGIINLVIVLNLHFRNRRLRLGLREKCDKRRATACPSEFSGSPSRIYRRRGAGAAGTLIPGAWAVFPRPKPRRRRGRYFPQYFPQYFPIVSNVSSRRTRATLSPKKMYLGHTRLRGCSRFWINGDKRDEKASSDRGRGPFD